MLPDHNEIIENRYQKAERLREQSINPFATQWNPSHTSADVRANEESLIASKDVVRVAGRIMTVRHMGKASFFHLKDNGGRIQIYLKKDLVPEDDYRIFKEFADMGDFVGVEGTVFITRTGELSVEASRVFFLTKSMRPLPEKWHGLTDKETRYRQRYVDLIVNDEVRDTFVQRSRVVAALRQYLTQRGYLEVETPMMHPVAGGATARPFVTHHNALGMPLYLRIAPELYLKRLTVGGLDKVFEINRNFRNEGVSVRHNPEFTMLELYTAYWNYESTMALTEDALKYVAENVFGGTEFKFGENEFHLNTPLPRISYLDAIRKYVPILGSTELSWSDPADVTLKKVQPAFRPEKTSSSVDILVELFEELVEPHLIEATFITDFPKAISPLAKSRPDNPLVAERFELYICGMEIANGYSELNDPREQYERFKEQVEAKARGDEEANDMDEDYIRALEYGMPPTSGLGIGIDRLTMLYTNSASIRDVILFPLMRPE